MRAFLVAIFAIFAAGAASAGPAADIVIWGGPIYTADSGHPKVEAVAITGKTITYAGDRAGAQALAGPNSKIIDLAGAALFPGFTDSHAHLDGIGERELTLNLEGSKSAAEVVARLKKRMVGVKPGELVFGRGWIETDWPEKRFLTASDLDQAAPDNPVIMERADGHAVTANHAALKLAGVTADSKAPEGGAILKDEAGQPTGMFVDNAMALINAIVPPRSMAARVKALKVGMAVENRYGWTGVHFMSAPWDDVIALEGLAKKGQAPLRVYAAVDRIDVPKLFESGPRNVADGRIVTRAIKLYADGAIGSRGAALFEPYADAPESKGLVLWDVADTRSVLKDAAQRGIQVCSHAIGDRGNGMTLDLYGEALLQEAAKGADLRWRIEHAQNIQKSDVPRFAALGVIASMQPSHAIGDLHFAEKRLGLARLENAYIWHSLLDAGAKVVGGSDAPVERGDPLIEFYAAVARKDLAGFSAEGWHPEQALSREQALRLFTIDAAFARFAEKELGSITVGKRADLTAFSLDLMTAPEAEIPKGHAVLTMVDGKIVYRAQ